MKISAGAILRALANRSRTRAAPTPTSDSTNSDPESEKNAASASPGGGAGQERLAGAGRPHEQHALRGARAHARVLAGVGQVVADLAQLGHRLARAGHVGERDLARRVLARACGSCRSTCEKPANADAPPSWPMRVK